VRVNCRSDRLLITTLSPTSDLERVLDYQKMSVLHA
jgi:hypothetical protein